ncbi:unnamed protein product [Protopolystoma xenopodis]|uniref:Anaphase-promoting complex subunit 4-like WD40 domain-containing protein n=1 Tax=Protopolystoma xenopodis TaxID=117903 RepID=A0A3S5B0J7_9PLAT|nr:unnamed protein product [Protopolystoma xenopodis]
MAEAFSFGAFEDKSVPKHKIEVAVWSPKMDLLAIGTRQGVVSILRYRMIQVWESSGTMSDRLGRVTHLAWRPDGQVLAAAHLTGLIRLLLLDNGVTLHEINLLNIFTEPSSSEETPSTKQRNPKVSRLLTISHLSWLSTETKE